MTNPKLPLNLYPDTPASSIEEDEFGRADFAKNLAKSIVGVPAKDGFVFALNAPWGSGKTSTLNMIQQTLREDAKVNDGKEFIIVNFNPWWFSGGDALIQDFFRQFRGALIEQSKGKQTEQAIKHIASKIRIFASVLTPFPVFGEWAKFAGGMAGGMERLFADPSENLGDIRKEIHDSLKKISDLRVLVVMDDLDRIQPNEMREMFRLVKGVADFPNTIYLLSFDREVVIGAIADKSGDNNGRDNAEKYLGKIIQMSLDLPPVEDGILRKYFDKQLAAAFPPVQTEEWDTGYWWNIFHDAASYFVKTPRDVKRWINNVGATYPMIRGEVDPMDFVAIQGLRTFTPAIYHAVQVNKPLFVETLPENFLEDIDRYSKASEIKERLGKEAQELSEHFFHNTVGGFGVPANKMLKVIFPFWNSHFQENNVTLVTPSYARFTSEEIREKNMARHPEIFDRYFRLSLSAGDFSVSDMKRRIEIASDPFKFSDMLLELAKEETPGKDHSRLRIFLERLMEFDMGDRMLAHAPGMLRAFLMVGDKPEVDSVQLVSLGRENSYSMRCIAEALLNNISDESKRFEICREAFEKGEAVMLMWGWMHMLEYDVAHGGKRESSRHILNEEYRTTLKKISVEKTRMLAKKGDAWNWRRPRALLSIIQREIGGEEWKECARKVISTSKGLSALCALDGHTNHLTELERITDINRNELADKARNYLNNSWQLDEEQEKALSALVHRVENPDQYND